MQDNLHHFFMQKSIILAVILLCVVTSLFSSVTVTYDMEPTLNIQTSLPPPFAPQNFGAHLGTLTFQRSVDDTSPIYDPSLIASNTGNTWRIIGPYSWWANEYGPQYEEDKTINLYPHAVFHLNGQLLMERLSPNAGKVPLTNTGSAGIDVSTFIVDLYVANVDSNFSGSQLKPNGQYQIVPGDIGTFTAAIAGPGVTIYDPGRIDLPIVGNPGEPPSSTSPFLGNASGEVEFHPERYVFTIEDNGPFSLDEVFTNGQALIANFKIILTDVCPLNVGMTYGVYVTFSDIPNPPVNYDGPSFCMNREDNAGDYAIEYFLNFLGQDIENGDCVLWDGFYGENTTYIENVYVKGIDSDAVNLVPEGNYQDTVYITITPQDHI